LSKDTRKNRMGPNGTVTSIGKPTQRLYSINVIFFLTRDWRTSCN